MRNTNTFQLLLCLILLIFSVNAWAQVCPDVNSVAATEDICSGNTAEIDAWQANVTGDADNAAAITDANTAGDVVYSTDLPADVDSDAPPAPAAQIGVHSGGNNCITEMQTVYAYLQCFGDDNFTPNGNTTNPPTGGGENTGDDSYLLLGTLELTIYPEVQDPDTPTTVEDADGCMVTTVTPKCSDTFGAAANVMGGAVANNWDANAGVYSPTIGELPGMIEVEVTSGIVGNVCDPLIITVATKGCLQNCPDVNEVPGAETICDGELGTLIDDWQAAVTGDADNAAAIEDANTAAVVYSSTPLVYPDAADGVLPDGVHDLADKCVTEIQTVYAYLECYGADADQGNAADNAYLLLGTYTLTVYPPYDVALVDMVMDDDCEVPIVASSCDNYVIIPNPANPTDPPTPNTNANFDYTIEYNTGPNDESCFSEPFQVNVNCPAEDCPAVADITPAAPTIICDGDLMDEFMDWQDAVAADADNTAAIADANTAAAVEYSSVEVTGAVTEPDGIVPSGVHALIDKCIIQTEEVYAYLECFGPDGDEGTINVDGAADNTYLPLGMFTLNIEPPTQEPISTTDGCVVTLDLACDNDAAALPAVANTTGDADGTNFLFTGGNYVYTAQPGDLAGTLTIEVKNEFECKPIEYIIDTPPCPAQCPAVNEVDDEATVCEGDLANEIMTWQVNVEADPDNTNALNDPNTSGLGLVYSSVAIVNGPDVVPDGITADDTHDQTDKCTEQEKTVYAYVWCFGVDADQGTPDDEYLLVGTFTLTVQPSTESEQIVLNQNDCTATVPKGCPNDVFAVAAAPNIVGDALAANFNAATGVYEAELGDDVGSIDIEVTNEFGCNPAIITLNTPACPADCPDVVQENGAETICDGELGDLITDWQADVAAANVAAINGNTSGNLEYSTVMLPTVAAPNNLLPNGVHSLADKCVIQTQIAYAYLLCFGTNAVEGGGDDSYLLLGTYTLMVEPSTEDPEIATVGCEVTLMKECPADVFAVAMPSNIGGDASAANFDAAAGVYTAQLGDLAGMIDIEVTNSFDCNPAIITLNTPACPGTCPAVVPADDAATICDGGAMDEIVTWQTGLITSNNAAIQDVNTAGTLEYSSVMLGGAVVVPDGIEPTGIHSGTDNCVAEIQEVYAYLLCYGADAAVGGVDAAADSYLALGMFTLTVEPSAQEPILDTTADCEVTLEGICLGDAFAVAADPNTTGGASGAKFDAVAGVYTAVPGDAAGTIDITVTNSFDCPITINLETPACLAECPAVVEVNDAATICDGALGTEIQAWQTAAIGGNGAAINDDNTAAILQYSSVLVPADAAAPDGNVADGVHSGTDVCIAETQTTYAYLLCFGDDAMEGTDDDIYLLVGTFVLTVNPDTQTPAVPTPSACMVTLAPTCPNDVLAVAGTPNETGDASAANFDATTGVYTAQPGDTAGSIDITVTNEFGCEAVTVTLVTPACPDCPATVPVDDMATICDGALTTEISDWQTAVATDATNTAAIADANTATALEYSSVLVPADAAAPDGTVADGVHSGTDVCIAETQTTYAYLLCFGDDATEGTGDDIYSLVGTFVLTVNPDTQTPAVPTASACMVTLVPICANDVLAVAGTPNETGDASAANFDATTGVYTAQPGDAAGSIDITVTNEFGCEAVTVTLVTPACPDCPATIPVDDMATICNGALTTEISDWQTAVATDATNTAAIADANTATALEYSSVLVPADAAAPDGTVADGVHSGTDVCIAETQTTYAYLLCFGDDATEGTGDDIYLLVGTFVLTVNPDTQTPAVPTASACMVTLAPTCPNDVLAVAGTPNETGDASAANFDAITGVYTAQPGDAAGSIDIIVTNEFSCEPITVTLATPACPAACPATVPVDDMATICDGALTTEISDWQTAVATDATNTAAIADANTATALEYSSVLVPADAAAPDGTVADGVHSGTDVCIAETQTTYAYLLCFGDDAMEGTDDDIYLLVGTFVLTVNPDTQTPAVPTASACMVTLVPICANDVLAVAGTPNETGDASAANFDATTGVYTAQPGDAAGSIDITVTNEFGCEAVTVTLVTPACPDCPATIPVDDMATICNGALTTEISDWQTAVATDATNTAAIADANTATALEYSSVLVPADAAAPDGTVADGVHSGTDVCVAETQTTYAYLLCFGNDATQGTADDIYLLVGTFVLTVNPDTQTPAVPTASACMVTLVPICANDVLAAAGTPNETGDASAANFDATTGVYTAQPGDTAGSIDITVTNEFGCEPVTVTLATPACPAACPATVPVDDMATICDGALATEISDWQTAVATDVTNMAAIADANTATALEYSSVLVPTDATAPDGNVADGVHSGTDVCVAETQTTYAYLLCFGNDATQGTDDDIYLLVGTFVLTVNPDTQTPTVPTASACMVTLVPICANDGLAVAGTPNETGDASAANFDTTTGVYTAQPGDAAGSIDITVTNEFGCEPVTVTLATPACPATPTCTLTLDPETVTCNAETEDVDTYTVSIPFDNGTEGAPGAMNYTVTTSGTLGGDNPMLVQSGIITITFTEGQPYDYSIEGTMGNPNESCDFSISGISPACGMFGDDAFMIVDPCSCNGDEVYDVTNSMATPTGVGTFSEFIVVVGPPGFTIGVDASSTNVPVGLNFTESPAGTYTSATFNHQSVQGYTAFITANGTIVGSVSNICAYPAFTLIADTYTIEVCSDDSQTPATTLTVPVTAMIDGQGVIDTQSAAPNPFDPNLGAGTYTLTYDITTADDGNNGIAPSFPDMPAYPGACSISFTQEVTVTENDICAPACDSPNVPVVIPQN